MGFNKVLYYGMADIDQHEPGTLSILLIEDDSGENVTFATERFAENAAFEAYMHGPRAAKVGPLFKYSIKSREGGVFKEIAGFLSKDE